MEWKIFIIVVLICHFPISIVSLWKLFRLRYKTVAMMAWNVTIMALPLVGATIFWSVLGIKALVKKGINEKSDN